MRARHKVRRLGRRFGVGVAVAGFLALVLVTYPRSQGGMEIPPGQGVYENFERLPAVVATPDG